MNPPQSRPPASPQSDEAASQAAKARANRLFRKKIPLIDKDTVPLNPPLRSDDNLSAEDFKRLDPCFRRILGRVPAEVATTFSERQLQALNQAFSNPSRHALDIRRQVSVFCLHYYLVLQAGPERRSPDRVKRSRRSWSSTSTALFTVLILGVGLFGYQAVYRRTLQPPSPKAVLKKVGIYPTALPWIQKKEDCKGAERQWKEGFCYDSSHSPDF